MNRIEKLFQSGKKDILSVYFTAGFPSLDDTVKIIKSLSDHGIDMIEIGVPFSDPMADGPVIQASGQKALNNGMSQKVLFSQLENIRQVTDIPLIMMSYINTAMQFGFSDYCKKCAEVGVDGLIIPDLPSEVYLSDYKRFVDENSLDYIQLITPETSDERIRAIDDMSRGFIYMVSSASTTGAQQSFSEAKQQYFSHIESMNLNNPTLVGFGVSNKETFRAAADHSRGCIVGSAFIKLLSTSKSIDEAVETLIRNLRG
ncbi:MAG: tryptophan synthase subunit alpha [Bacteroidales bacterium]|nr:tryptophan synthase subunit alpha [Bacteroidales bacterium]